jgi:hypothetical protein
VLEPTDPGPHFGKGISLQESGNLSESLAFFDSAINLNPDDPARISGKDSALPILTDLRRHFPVSTQ